MKKLALKSFIAIIAISCVSGEEALSMNQNNFKVTAQKILSNAQWCNTFEDKVKLHFDLKEEGKTSYFYSNPLMKDINALKDKLTGLKIDKCVQQQNSSNKYGCYVNENGIKGYLGSTKSATNKTKIIINSTENPSHQKENLGIKGCIFDAYPSE